VLMQPWSNCKAKHAKAAEADAMRYDPRGAAEKAMRVKGRDRVPQKFAHMGRAGPGRYCPPRHTMPCNSRNEGSKCVG
jgi:hypothetical protein